MTDTAATPVPALHLSGLVKRFGEKTAVAGVDLVVPQGSFFGLVGPNGAGKTTTLSMATGLLRPDAGSAWVHGVDVWANPVAANAMIGNLADGVRLFDRLTGGAADHVHRDDVLAAAHRDRRAGEGPHRADGPR